jgi:esterase/lipase
MQNAGGDVSRMSAVLGIRHRPSGLNTRFLSSHLSFAEYITHTRNMLARARTGCAPSELDRIVEGNSPFELFPVDERHARGKGKPYRRSILLIHGLTDSPYFMRHLAAFFQENGFRVMAVLLPGHGTRPGDLIGMDWQEWAKAVSYGVERLAQEADEIYLGGYSAGGALSVYHSLNDKRISGLFLFAPALKISSKAFFANFHKSYSWLIPSAEWLHIYPDNDIYKYESFPKNAAAQMYALTRVLQKRTAGVAMTLPIFAAVSQDDATVDTSTTVEFMAQAKHPSSKLVYYFSDEEKLPKIPRELGVERVNSVFPEKNIVGSAHTAIVLPPEDRYYGVRGEYRNCLHYYSGGTGEYDECFNGGDEIKQGEVTEKNLHTGMMRRLMYNPNYPALKVAMQQFIASLPD